MNLEKINPLKRDKVVRGIALVEEVNARRKTISKVMIFGSAVREDCTEESDVDVCLFSDCPSTDECYRAVYGGLGLVMDDIVDVFNFWHLGEKLQKEIMKKGVVAYVYAEE